MMRSLRAAQAKKGAVRFGSSFCYQINIGLARGSRAWLTTLPL
jgi:hypothetical protein